jgi:hypothetical protein
MCFLHAVHASTSDKFTALSDTNLQMWHCNSFQAVQIVKPLAQSLRAKEWVPVSDSADLHFMESLAWHAPGQSQGR